MAETKARFLADTQKADTTAEAFTMPTGRASENNYVLAMTDKDAGTTGWQATATAPTITSVSGLLNDDSDSTLTLVGLDFKTTSTVKLYDADAGGNLVASSSSLDTSGVPTKLVATFGHANLTKNATLYVEASNSGINARHSTGITVSGDPIGAGSTANDWFSGATGTDANTSTHLGNYGAYTAGGNDSNTKLLLNFDKGGGTTVPNDASGASHAVSVNGTAIIKASPFGDGKSAMFFDGSNDRLTIPTSSDFQFGSTNSFTVEFWVRPEGTIGTAESICSLNNSGSTDSDFYCRFESGKINWYNNNDHTSPATSDFVTGTWYHVAFVRTHDGSNGTMKCYKDGTELYSFTDNYNYDGNGEWGIGARKSAGSWTQHGEMYIDEFRIVKGTNGTNGAVYTGNFTVPTSRLTAITNTKLLIHSNRTLRDSSDQNHELSLSSTGAYQRSITADRNSVDGANWSDSAWYFTGGASIVVPQSTALDLNTSPDHFTLEMWIYPTRTEAQWVILQGDGGSANTKWGMKLDSSNKVSWRARKSGSYTDIGVSTNAIAVNQWTHIAICRVASNYHKLYINGTEDTGGTWGDAWANTYEAGTTDARIGSLDGSTTEEFEGYLSDVRLTTGLSGSVYTGNFTPPTGPLTKTWSANPFGGSNTAANSDASKVKLLVHGNEGTSAEFVDSTTSHNITPTGSVHSVGHGGIAPAMAWPNNLKDFGSAGIFLDGDSDYLTIPYSDDLNYNFANSAFSIDMWIYPTSVGSVSQVLYMQGNDTNNRCFLIYLGNGGFQAYSKHGGTERLNLQTSSGTGTTIPSYQWSHIAMTRDTSGVHRLYINGKYQNKSTDNTNSGMGHNYYIGRHSYASNDYFKGYIDGIRVSKGVVLYTGSNQESTTNAYTVPTEIYGGSSGLKPLPTNPPIIFEGTATSPSLASDEDLHFTEVENTSNATNQKKLSDLGLTIDNTYGNANQASLTGNLNLGDSVAVNNLGVKVQVRKTLSNSAGTSGQATITFSGGTTTAGLSPDMVVTGTGINASETKITSVDSSTQITVNNNHAGTVSGDLIFYDPDRVHFINKVGTYHVWDNPSTGGLTIQG